jgi:hypothetical protein
LIFFLFKSESAFAYNQIVELQDHPFYIGVQYHPEFKSRPRRPSPPFTGVPISYALMVVRELFSHEYSTMVLPLFWCIIMIYLHCDFYTGLILAATEHVRTLANISNGGAGASE